MKQKYILFYTLIIILIALQVQSQSAKPNVVYILTDQWRGSATGYAGDPNVLTPELDKFAEKAVNFTNAVSVCPVCTPHRASLLTGKFPTSTGMFVNDIYLPSEELCMAEIFKAEGYNTAYLGKWHLDGHGRMNNVVSERRQGFDYWKALECSHNYNEMPYYDNDDLEIKYWEGYSPLAIAADANQYLDKNAENEKPFLLFISIGTPHFPHHSAPKKFKEMYPLDALQLPPNVPEKLEEKTRKEMQGYYGHCTATDEAVEKILKKLERLSLMENTIVVFTSDHGEMMGSQGVRPFAKQLAWDESMKVPFLIHYPSIAENKGKIVNAPINTPDILPSLLGMAGIEIPKTIEGEDLSELMINPDPDYDRAALVMNVAPFGGNYKDPEFRAVRTSRYTYARTLEGPSMLYDNEKDPYQMNNLLDQSEYKAIQNKLEKQLKKKLKKIDDKFKARDYYMNKWNLEFEETRNAIDYRSWNKGEGIVQSPHLDQ